jgi:hypothetical protein
MTTLALAIVLAAAFVQTPASPQSSDATRAIVKSYLEIQAHLAADRFEDVKGPAQLLVSQATALGKEGTELARAASSFAKAGDLFKARDEFGAVSDAVIARVKADGSSDVARELRLGFCPMNRKSWLQREEQVRNPYYGTKMLTCGEVRAVK